MNRLAAATSPYLQQHADNPVDWWEWGPEALEVARTLDRPILLSVGYAACHWCHVMAHESFEDPATAAFMNEHFVNIKVDREERPDVDAIYMRATQAMTGQGGWPMTCVMTPDGVPFFAGTYFPPEPRGGHPAFTQVLQALTDAWRERRDEIEQAGEQVREYLADTGIAPGGSLTPDHLSAAATTLGKDFDEEAAGFGAAPKFPPSMVLEFLLRHAERTGDDTALTMVDRTCEAMARGGMYDQLGGGFARYSVDRYWRVPHFEKMLYDNALLLRLYTHWWRQTGSELGERIARETARFLLDELQTAEGGFASALDADSDGHEGTYYVWNPNQLMRTLGAADGAWASGLLGVTAAGTFERGFSTLQLPADPDDPERWGRVRRALLDVRSERTRPARDDKIVASWNALTITALAEAGVLFEEPDLTDAAVRAATLLWDVHIADGRLVRTSRDGVASRNAGVLDDYALVAEAFVSVLGFTGDAVWLERAVVLGDRILEHFADPEGGWFDTADDAEQLLVRPKDISDNVTPSGTSAVAHAMLALAAVTGEDRYRDAAELSVDAAGPLARQVPRYAGWTLAAAEALLAGPAEIAVVGDDDALHRAALGLPSPGAVVVRGEEGLRVPLFEDKTRLDGATAVYICRDHVCQRPVASPEDL
ncbi:thioredoxin domain-containing protein [Aeromicrobium sp. YIM 150415]|uniref:thioredoxin domain-containing protein n=1 Tax=Aeromicrobium sp. YIM 150415 TaxID=2803912 RepID=UPI0019660A4B|nr:thioredoxin domain-containing protein [Aeromicrobium sp. YIM 150415]MBM9465087.1 thioredoxin domain-containing protein [Aeromicrobium sp. YIM 150415]